MRDYCVYAEQTDTHFSLNAFAAPGIALVSVVPLKDFQAIFKQRFWRLAQSKDEFVGATRQDPTGRAGKYVGSELDLPWPGPSARICYSNGVMYRVKGSYYSIS
jgi:hypothetical protein